jgi:hypothetical protein
MLGVLGVPLKCGILLAIPTPQDAPKVERCGRRLSQQLDEIGQSRNWWNCMRDATLDDEIFVAIIDRSSQREIFAMIKR